MKRVILTCVPQNAIGAYLVLIAGSPGILGLEFLRPENLLADFLDRNAIKTFVDEHIGSNSYEHQHAAGVAEDIHDQVWVDSSVRDSSALISLPSNPPSTPNK